MEINKDDLSLEHLIISAGLWLLQNPEKKVHDFDSEYVVHLKVKLETACAEMQGSVH
jgi:hypothetical protein